MADRSSAEVTSLRVLPEGEPRSDEEVRMRKRAHGESIEYLSDRRVLITGGGGFIGSNLAAWLAPHAEVTVLDDFTSGARENVRDLPGVKIKAADVRDHEAVAEAVADQDVLVHMAAMAGVQRTIDNPVDTLEVNVDGTRTVLEMALEADVDRVLFTSTSEMYGDLSEPPYREDGPIAPKTNYAVAKAVNERYVRAYCDREGIPYTIVRYFNVYGPNQDGSTDGYVVPKFVRRALADETIPVYGSGEQSRDFTYIDDAIDGTVRALGLAGRDGTFNIGTGVETSVRTLADRVAEVVGSGRVEHVEDPRPYRVERRCADVTRARERLGYVPQVPLREGIDRVAESVTPAEDERRSRDR